MIHTLLFILVLVIVVGLIVWAARALFFRSRL